MKDEQLQRLAGAVLTASDEVKRLRGLRESAAAAERRAYDELREAERGLESVRWELIAHSEGGDMA